jgi:hypothetical protein
MNLNACTNTRACFLEKKVELQMIGKTGQDMLTYKMANELVYSILIRRSFPLPPHRRVTSRNDPPHGRYRPRHRCQRRLAIEIEREPRCLKYSMFTVMKAVIWKMTACP